MSEHKSGNNSLIIILGVIGGFVICLFACCGFGAYYLFNTAQEAQKQFLKIAELSSFEPKEINNAKDEITQINIPVILIPSSKQKMSMSGITEKDFQGFGDLEKMTEGPFCIKISYEAAVGKVTSLEIAGFMDPPYTADDKKAQTEYLKDQLEYDYKEIKDDLIPDVPGDSEPKYKSHSVEKLERQIRGEKVTFKLHAEGGKSASAPKYWILEGTFPGKHGPAKILLRAEGDEMEHVEIVRMVDSIQ